MRGPFGDFGDFSAPPRPLSRTRSSPMKKMVCLSKTVNVTDTGMGENW
jgi:hypothetical protein